MGFSRQEHWSGLPFPFPGDLSDPGIQPGSPALQANSLSSEEPGKPVYFKSPNRGYLSCSQAKGSPSSKGTSSLFSPKTEVLGIKLQALSDSDKSQFAGEVSSYFSYFGSFGICIPVFHLHCLSLLEYVQLHALSVRWVWEEEFVRSCSGETRLSTHWPQRPSPQGIRGDKEGKAVGPELRVLTRYLLRVLITA